MSPTAVPAARDRLRIAIQKSGRLSDPARALLASCGLSWRESRDKLFCYGETLPVDLLLVRDDDIPGLLADGVCDYGIVGRNVLDEQAALRAAEGKPQVSKEVRALGFGGTAWMSSRSLGLGGSAAPAGPAHRHQLPRPAGSLAGGAGRGGVGGGAVGLGGDRAAPGPGRRGLRPGVQRRHAHRQPAAAGGHDHAQRGGAGRPAAAVRRHPRRTGADAAAAARWRAAVAGQPPADVPGAAFAGAGPAGMLPDAGSPRCCRSTVPTRWRCRRCATAR